jgi:hypothetical protein
MVSHGFGAVALKLVSRPKSGNWQPSDGIVHRPRSPSFSTLERVGRQGRGGLLLPEHGHFGTAHSRPGEDVGGQVS